MLLEFLQLQNRYDSWLNNQLFEVCALMSDEERKRDLGAFFRSIHGTFNHLLLGDKLWFGRLTGEPFAITSLAQELHTDFGELRQQQTQMDQQIADYLHNLSEIDLGRELTYVSAVDGQTRCFPLQWVLSHLFSHHVHHRGQITVLINQLGHSFGETDLLAMPEPILRLER